MPKSQLRLGRFVWPYLIIAVICLVVGALVSGAGPLFIAGAFMLGAFFPIAAIYFVMQGLRGNM